MPAYDLAKNVSDGKFYSKYFYGDAPMRKTVVSPAPEEERRWARRVNGTKPYAKEYRSEVEESSEAGKGVTRGVWTFGNPPQNELNRG